MRARALANAAARSAHVAWRAVHAVPRVAALDRRARDATRPVRWTVRTAWTLWRVSPERTASARTFARLWWRERRKRRDDHLELLRFRDGDATLGLWVGEFCDLHVIREAFGDQTYRLPDAVQPHTILDLGANLGASVLWFHRRFPDAEIHAVEPDQRSLRKLRRNVGALPGVTVYAAAVAAEPGRRPFYEAKRAWSSSLYGGAAAESRRATVNTLTLPTLVRQCLGRQRVDLLKLDVEGAEWELLARWRLAELADVVAGEVHVGMLGDEQAERDAWRHGLAGFDVHFGRTKGSGHFIALPSRGAPD
jgi:FkbM family methyltransferase